MSKKLLLVALAIIVAAGFAGCAKKSDQLTLTIGDSKTDNAAAIEKFSGSMNDLIASGKTVKCDYEVTLKDLKQKSTIYVDGKKMRLEGVMTAAGQKDTTMHMIVDEQYNYIWSDDATSMAIKMKTVDVNANTDKSAASGDNSKVDMDMKLEMNCENWTSDAAEFTPPANVKFTDFSEMMNGLLNQ